MESLEQEYYGGIEAMPQITAQQAEKTKKEVLRKLMKLDITDDIQANRIEMPETDSTFDDQFLSNCKADVLNYKKDVETARSKEMFIRKAMVRLS